MMMMMMVMIMILNIIITIIIITITITFITTVIYNDLGFASILSCYPHFPLLPPR